MQRKLKIAVCDGCDTEKPIYATGRCQPCYWKHRTEIKGGPRAIPTRTKKRAAQERQYLALRAVWLPKNAYCKAQLTGCTFHASDVHHMAGREGLMLLYTPYWLPVCRNCHNWIEANGEEAKRLGFSLQRT